MSLSYYGGGGSGRFVSNPTPPVDTNRLIPGQGFPGPTTVNAVGVPSSPGWSYKPISRWMATPYDVKTTVFQLGIVAFHRNGIGSVNFQANGGPVVSVASMSYNATTRLWDYNVIVDPRDYPTGVCEIRAWTLPKTAGQPRIHQGLVTADVGTNTSGGQRRGEHSMFIYMDSTDSLAARTRYVDNVNGLDTNNGTFGAPYLSIRQAIIATNTFYSNNSDWVRIKLKQGNGSYFLTHPTTGGAVSPTTVNGWLSVEGDTGTNVAIDKLLAGTSIRTKHLALRNLKFSVNNQQSATLEGDAWFDRVEKHTGFNGLSGGVWSTDCTCTNPPGGFATFGATLSLNDTADTIWSDVGQGGRCIAGRRATNVERTLPGGDPQAHPDIWQATVPGVFVQNALLYCCTNYRCNSQGPFLSGLQGASYQDVAIVNWHNDGNLTVFTAQVDRDIKHFLLLGSTIRDQVFRFRNPDSHNNLPIHVECARVEGNCLQSLDFMGDRSQDVDVTVYNNNYDGGSMWGDLNGTIGVPAFVNEAADDYRPAVNSILRPAQRNNKLFTLVPRDANGNERTGSVGAFEYVP